MGDCSNYKTGKKKHLRIMKAPEPQLDDTPSVAMKADSVPSWSQIRSLGVSLPTDLTTRKQPLWNARRRTAAAKLLTLLGLTLTRHNGNGWERLMNMLERPSSSIAR